LAVDMDDLVLYAIYPVTGKKFLQWKYGKEPVPDEVRPRTMDQVKAEQELIAKAKAGELVPAPGTKPAPDKGEGLRTFNVFVDDAYFEVGVEEVGGAPVVRYAQPLAAPASPAAAPAAPASAPAPAAPAAPAAAKAPAAAPAAAVEGTPLTAPMPGMIVSVAKKEGDAVSEGETVVVLEAMKMENALSAPAGGTIKAVNVASGDSVAKGDVLCVIG
jgi:pyruvate carboxylase subunit B